MKLKRILFESVSKEEFIEKLKKAFETKRTELSNTIPDVEQFYEEHKDKIGKILSDATEFTYIGSGVYGSAFDIGKNMILKFDIQGGRAKKTLADFSANEKEGFYYPMIYDHGSLGHVYYTILEKFETKSIQKYKKLLNKIFFHIGFYITLSKEEVLEKILSLRDREKENFDQMESDLRLNSNWLEKLVSDTITLEKKGVGDAHAGNLGIRRIGGEGFFVFFD